MSRLTERRRGRSLISDEGQAVVETLMLTFVLILFFAMAFQVFLVNRTIYRSLTAVHAMLFERAFERNCFESRSDGSCDYTQDPEADGVGGVDPRVVWTPVAVPETAIPVVGAFRSYTAFAGPLRLSSNRAGGSAGGGSCPGPPCKQTRLGAGTRKGPIDGILLLRRARYSSQFSPEQMLNSIGALGSLWAAVD